MLIAFVTSGRACASPADVRPDGASHGTATVGRRIKPEERIRTCAGKAHATSYGMFRARLSMAEVVCSGGKTKLF